MRRLRLLLWPVSLFFWGCTDMKGKIQKRGIEETVNGEKSKSVYLVNTSINQKYIYTIKMTSTYEDNKVSYETRQITLEPGDETTLGTDKEFYEIIYKKKKMIYCYYIQPNDSVVLKENTIVDYRNENLTPLQRNNDSTLMTFPDSSIGLIDNNDVRVGKEVGAQITKIDTIIDGRLCIYKFVNDKTSISSFKTKNNKYSITGFKLLK